MADLDYTQISKTEAANLLEIAQAVSVMRPDERERYAQAIAQSYLEMLDHLVEVHDIQAALKYIAKYQLLEKAQEAEAAQNE